MGGAAIAAGLDLPGRGVAAHFCKGANRFHFVGLKEEMLGLQTGTQGPISDYNHI
jgi:hypothetical protein